MVVDQVSQFLRPKDLHSNNPNPLRKLNDILKWVINLVMINKNGKCTIIELGQTDGVWGKNLYKTLIRMM